MSDNAVSPLEIPSGAVLLHYVINTAANAAVLLVLSLFWGQLILVDFSQLWGFNPGGLLQVWWIFGWAALFALIGAGSYTYESKPMLLWRAAWLSLNAGFWEELLYRCVLFCTAMIAMPFLNFITFGLVGWLNTAILIPFTNWVTFGALAPQLYGATWVLGAAVISAAGDFRDAHKYLGWFGWLNSWFLGMVFFWLMFNYGIITAMVAHAVYDLILLSARALKSERSIYYRFSR